MICAQEEVMSDTKQVVLVRKDLKMKKAALAALAAKASAEVFTSNGELEGDVLSVQLSPMEVDWLVSGSTRIILGVPSEGVLRTIVAKAGFEGIQSYPVVGKVVTPESYERTEESEMLCASLGPDESDKIDKITGHLKLL
jgi:peptidyl-tRNA hydrolase, PTH2 family